jgi:hypothetical protein
LAGLKSHFSGEIESQIFQREEKDFIMMAKQIKSKLDPSDFLVFLPSSDTSTIGIVDAFDKEGILTMMK